MANPRAQDLTTGSIPWHLFRLSVPMIWGILTIVSMQLADVYFVAGLGHHELEAISFTFPVGMVIFNLVMGLSIATSATCARLIGAGAHDELKHFIAHALLIAVLAGLMIAICGEMALPFIFPRLGASAAHMPDIMAFMRISLWGYFFITVPMVINSSLRAAGDTFVPSLIMIGIAVVNIPLAWAFVYGHGGLPALGMAGAATANVISNAIAALLASYVLWQHRMIDRHALNLKGFRTSARRLLGIALPVGVMNLVQPLSVAIITALLATSGASYVAGYGIIGRIEAMAMVVLMAVSIGMTPLIGQNFGAGRFDRIEETIAVAIRFCVLWSSLISLGLMLSAREIAGLFTVDPTVVQVIAMYFLIGGITSAVGNIAVGWGTAWNALGKPQYSVVMVLGRFFVGGVGLAVIGHMIAGWQGLFIGLALGNLLLGFALHFWSVQKFKTLVVRAA